MKATSLIAVSAGLAMCASTATAQVLYNNGPLATGNTTGSGVAAPPGAQWSECAEDCANPGDQQNTTAGFRAISTTDRIADDFTVPAGGWNITTVNFFGYQTGSSTTSTFTACTLRIWN